MATCTFKYQRSQRNQDDITCVSGEDLMELIDDAELLKVVKERLDEDSVQVSLDDL
mgnify:CR=1 FL=1